MHETTGCSKEQQAKAQAKGEAMFSLVIDGKTRTPKGGRFAMCGPVPKELEDKLWAWIQEYGKRHAAKKK